MEIRTKLLKRGARSTTHVAKVKTQNGACEGQMAFDEFLQFYPGPTFLPLTSPAKVSTTYSPIDFVLKGKMKGEGFHCRYSNG